MYKYIKTRISVAPKMPPYSSFDTGWVKPFDEFFTPLVQQMPFCDNSFQMCYRWTECPTLGKGSKKKINGLVH